MRVKIVLILSVLAILGLTACVGSDATLGDMFLARSLDESGMPSETSETFNPGDVVYLAVEFTGGYKGLEATASWYNPDGGLLTTETLTLPRDVNSLDKLWISSALQTEDGWPEGTYRCDLFVPDQGTMTLSFQLENTDTP